MAAARRAQRRLVAHLSAGGTTDLAASCLKREATIYTDATRHQQEKKHLFETGPIVVGLSQDLAAPGDVLVFENLDRSILLTRDASGEIHGFWNMCAHRGARLIMDASDGDRLHRSQLSCPFHGWRYGLDGRLCAVPGAEGFDDVTLSSRRLSPVAVLEWNGLILLSLDSEVDPAKLLSSFASITDVVAELELNQLRRLRDSTIEARCNWKLAIDTYAENYHFGVLHGASLAGAYISNVTAFDDFAPHWRAFFPESSLMDLIGCPENSWPDPIYRAVLFLFPNTVLVVGTLGEGKTLLRSYRVFPGAEPGQSICRMSVYVDASVSDVPDGLFADESDSLVTREDYSIAENIQVNLDHAPHGHSLVFGRNEIGVQAFHLAVDAQLNKSVLEGR